MVKGSPDTDTLDPDARALQDSFWGRSDRRSRADLPSSQTADLVPSRRRTPRPQKKRRGRTLLALLVVGSLLGAAVAGGWYWRNRMHDPATSSAISVGEDPVAAPVVAPATPAAVMMHRRADGALDLVAVVGTNADRSQSAITFVPVLTQLDVPANGIQQLAELGRLGGIPLVDLALNNMLGIATAKSAMTDDTTLRAMFDASGPVLVALRTPITLTAPDVSLPAGAQTLNTDQAIAVVTRTPAGTNELDHLDAVRLVFDAWIDALRAAPDKAAALAQQVPQIAPLLTAAANRARLDTLPVDGIGLGTDERYQVRTSEADALVTKAYPDARYRTTMRPRIEVKGAEDRAVLAASRCIVSAGGNVRLTGTAEPADITSVVYYRDRSAEAARQMRAALKAGQVKKADRDLGLVDVTIVVGKDVNGCQ